MWGAYRVEVASVKAGDFGWDVAVRGEVLESGYDF